MRECGPSENQAPCVTTVTQRRVSFSASRSEQPESQLPSQINATVTIVRLHTSHTGHTSAFPTRSRSHTFSVVSAASKNQYAHQAYAAPCYSCVCPHKSGLSAGPIDIWPVGPTILILNMVHNANLLLHKLLLVPCRAQIMIVLNARQNVSCPAVIPSRKHVQAAERLIHRSGGKGHLVSLCVSCFFCLISFLLYTFGTCLTLRHRNDRPTHALQCMWSEVLAACQRGSTLQQTCSCS